MSPNSNFRQPSLFFQDPDSYSNYLDSSIRLSGKLRTFEECSLPGVAPKFFTDDLYQKQNQDLLLKQQRLNIFLSGPQYNLTSGAKTYANYKYFNSATSDVIPDKVSKIFLSPQNIYIVQKAIKGLVKIQTSYVIPDQSDAFLATTMRDVLEKHNKSLQYDFLEQVRTLNGILIDQCVYNAVLAIKAQDNYFKSLNKIYFLDSNPQATSIKGLNVLELKKPQDVAWSP